MGCCARSCLLAPLLPLSRTYFYYSTMRLPALLRNHAQPRMAKALTHYQGERNQNCAEQGPYRSETGPLGLACRLPARSCRDRWPPPHNRSWLTRLPVSPDVSQTHECVEPPEYRRSSADAHFSGLAETLRLAERGGMLSSRVRVPAKHTFTCLSGPVCMCCAVCTILCLKVSFPADGRLSLIRCNLCCT